MTQIMSTSEEEIHTICHLSEELYVLKIRKIAVIESLLTNDQIEIGNDRISKQFQRLLEKHHLKITTKSKLIKIYPLQGKNFKVDGIILTKNFNTVTKEHTITIVSENLNSATDKYKQIKISLKFRGINILSHECHPHITTSLIKNCNF